MPTPPELSREPTDVPESVRVTILTARQVALATALALACAFVVIGVALWSGPVAWIIGGVLLGAWSWLVLGEVS